MENTISPISIINDEKYDFHLSKKYGVFPDGREKLFWKLFNDRVKLQILQIGVLEGISTIWCLENLKDCDCVLVDNGSYSGFGALFNNLIKWNSEFYKRCRVIKEDSSKALFDIDSKFDFIYIDGCHEDWKVYLDSVLSWRLLVCNGILIWDDYEWDLVENGRTPKKGIDRFLEEYDGEFDLIEKSYNVVIRKL